MREIAQATTEPVERWLNNSREFGGNVKFPFLDEFLAENVDIHFEMMGDAQFWMSITCRETGRMWHINAGALSSRAHGYSHVDRVNL